MRASAGGLAAGGPAEPRGLRRGRGLGAPPDPAGAAPGPRRPTAISLFSDSLSAGLGLLVHQDELGDRTMGVVAGYCPSRPARLTGTGPSPWSSALSVTPMGAPGRELVAASRCGPGAMPVVPGRAGRPASRSGACGSTGPGVLAEGRARAQPFALDLVAGWTWTTAQQSDDLRDTVNYGVVAQPAAQW